MDADVKETTGSLRNSARRSGVWQRLRNRPVQYLLDTAVLSFAFLLSYAVRFELSLDGANLARCLRQLPLVVLLLTTP